MQFPGALNMGRNKFMIETKGFAELAGKLDKITDNIEGVICEALENAGEDVSLETLEAVEDSNLPAKGKFSKGNTKETVILNPKASVKGFTVEIGMGFDKTKNGAGTLLITGTPRMKPDRELERMFARKKYAAEINKQIQDSIVELIEDEMGG